MQDAIEVLVKLVEQLQKETWKNEEVRNNVVTGVMLSIDKLKASK